MIPTCVECTSSRVGKRDRAPELMRGKARVASERQTTRHESYSLRVGMRRFARLALVGAAALVLAGCVPGMAGEGGSSGDVGPTEGGSDIAQTFDNAVVVLPGPDGGAPLVTRMNAPELKARLARGPKLSYPTILYMHGCNGVGSVKVLRALAERGFAVIAPDSFARRYRPLQCSAWRQSGGRNVFVYDFRQTEISYALHRIEGTPWVDRRRMFLYGSSEGGLATAIYRGYAFRARVVTQWTGHGSPLVRGLMAQPNEPVLTIVRADDPWYSASRTPGQAGHCGVFIGKRSRSRSVVLEGGGGHDVYGNPRTIPLIADFLVREARLVDGKK